MILFLRLYEATGSAQATELFTKDSYSKAFSCNMLEDNEQELIIVNKVFHLEFKPFEIKTIKLVKN